MGLILLLRSLGLLAQTDSEGLLRQADEAFAYAQYSEALRGYEALYAQGVVTEEMLYRLAWLHEQAGEVPLAIFYLRAVQVRYGGDRIEAKIGALMAQSQARAPTGGAWSGYRQAIYRQQNLLHGLLLVSTLLTIGLWLGVRQPIGGWLGLAGALLALGTGGILLEQHWNRPTQAVVIQPTACYEAPGFAAPYQHLPLAPGATVTITDQQDIWSQVRWATFSGWVPNHSLRPLTLD
ncbi:MAG: hypothetical protein D6722_13780 [Bacteroidetes bacterium]|nr:MAG: hypothetical protein D6722_13780 [Bacteroidota bacterium]